MSKTCNGCGNTELQTNIPYVAHESAMSRADRQNKRLWIVIILLVFLLVTSNCVWLWYESQFETVSQIKEYDASADDGGNAVINDDGSVELNDKI